MKVLAQQSTSHNNLHHTTINRRGYKISTAAATFKPLWCSSTKHPTPCPKRRTLKESMMIGHMIWVTIIIRTLANNSNRWVIKWNTFRLSWWCRSKTHIIGVNSSTQTINTHQSAGGQRTTIIRWCPIDDWCSLLTERYSSFTQLPTSYNTTRTTMQQSTSAGSSPANRQHDHRYTDFKVNDGR